MSTSQDRPNILFVFSDQQRWDTLGCYGQPLEVTPNLDRMAAEGVRFANAFTCQPVCGPARACLQTGKYATPEACLGQTLSLGLRPRSKPQNEGRRHCNSMWGSLLRVARIGRPTVWAQAAVAVSLGSALAAR